MSDKTDAKRLVLMRENKTIRIQKFWSIWTGKYFTSLREIWRTSAKAADQPKWSCCMMTHIQEPIEKWPAYLNYRSRGPQLLKQIPGGNITSRAIQHLYPLEIEQKGTIRKGYEPSRRTANGRG